MNWKLVKVKFQSIDEATGKDKTVTEQHLFDAYSFTEAETNAIKIFEEEIGGDFNITHITPYKVTDVFFGDGEIWCRAKVVYTAADEATGKEKKVNTYALIKGDSIKEAREALVNELKDCLVPYKIEEIKETKIIEVYPYNYDQAQVTMLEKEGFKKVHNENSPTN